MFLAFGQGGPVRARACCAWMNWIWGHACHGCAALNIRRRGVHGFRSTAAGEFISIKQALGFTEVEARRELALWLGHNPHRTEVTCAYVPTIRGA